MAILKRLMAFCLVLIVSIGLVSCDGTPSADNTVAQQVESSVISIIEKHGVPSIVNGRDYATAKEIYELRDAADFGTYTYIVSETTGGLKCAGKSVGYPLPASVQIANPERFVSASSTYGTLTLPQAESNALFMPDGLDATYQRIIDPTTGGIVVGYFEEDIVVFPYEVPNAERSCASLYGGK